MSELRLWLLRLSTTRWMVLAKRYSLTTYPTMRANSVPERSGVAVVKCRPVFWLHDAKSVRGAPPLVLVVMVWLASPAWLGSASAHRRAALLVFRPYKPQF